MKKGKLSGKKKAIPDPDTYIISIGDYFKAQHLVNDGRRESRGFLKKWFQELQLLDIGKSLEKILIQNRHDIRYSHSKCSLFIISLSLIFTGLISVFIIWAVISLALPSDHKISLYLLALFSCASILLMLLILYVIVSKSISVASAMESRRVEFEREFSQKHSSFKFYLSKDLNRLTIKKEPIFPKQAEVDDDETGRSIFKKAEMVEREDSVGSEPRALDQLKGRNRTVNAGLARFRDSMIVKI